MKLNGLKMNFVESERNSGSAPIYIYFTAASFMGGIVVVRNIQKKKPTTTLYSFAAAPPSPPTIFNRIRYQ